jgi:hypothetical protein
MIPNGCVEKRAFFSQNNKTFFFVLFYLPSHLVSWEENFIEVILFNFSFLVLPMSTTKHYTTLYNALKTKGKIQKLRAKEFN